MFRTILLVILCSLPFAANAGSYTFRAAGTVDYAITVEALTPGAPSGLTSGDLMVAIGIQRAVSQTWSASTGWTSLGSDNLDNWSVEFFCRIADGGANDSLTLTPTGTTSDVGAVILAYHGDVYTDCSTIVAHSDLAGNEAQALSALLMPGLTITTDDTLVIGCGMRYKTTTSNDATTITTSGGGLTKRVQHIQSGNAAMMFACADQQQTTATNYDGTDFTRDGTDENQSSNGVIISLLSDAGGTPAGLDSGPTFSVVDSNTLRATFDADANASNAFLAVLFNGSAACTCDDIEANTCTGEINYATAATTGASQTLDVDVTLPASDPLPLNDLDFCVEGAGGDSSVTSGNAQGPLTEPADYNYVQVTGSPGVGEIGIFDGASPAAASGDTGQVREFCDSFAEGANANALTVAGDTTFIIDTDGDTSRQNCPRRFADYSAQAWSDAAVVDYYVNNQAPVYIGLEAEEGIDPYLFEVDVALSYSVNSLFDDAEGDAMTLTVANNASGLTVSGGDTWDGVPDTCGSNPTLNFEAMDIAGDTENQTEDVKIGDRVPDFTGDDGATYDAEVEALCSFVGAEGEGVYSELVAAGIVAEVSPVVGTLVEFDSTITYEISLGPAPPFVGGDNAVIRLRGFLRGMRTY